MTVDRRIILVAAIKQIICGICGESLEKEYAAYLKFREANVEMRKMGKRLNSPSKRRRKININIDHIVPHSKGGLSELSNYQLTHTTCNTKKGNELNK